MTGRHRITFNPDLPWLCGTCGKQTEWHEFFSGKSNRTVHFVRHDPRDYEARPWAIIRPAFRVPMDTRP